MAKEIRVPTLGESVTEATIGQWFKKSGEAVADGETLVELEPDKVTLEVPSPGAGTLGEVVANEGDTVEVDALLALLDEGEGAKAAAPAAEAPASAPAASAAAPAVTDMPPAPSAAKMMAE